MASPDIGIRQRPQQQAAAAGADRRQHPLRRMADDQEDGARRRLLDHLEERIGARDRQILGAVDDADPIAAIGRGRAEHVERLAHRIDGDRRRGGLSCPSPARGAARKGWDGRAPRLGAPHGNRAGHPACRWSDRGFSTGRGRLGRPDRRGSPCRYPGDRRSARHGGGGPAQPLQKGRLAFLVAEKGELLARMRRALETVRARSVLIVTRHRGASPHVRSVCGRRSRSAAQIAASTSSGDRSASMTTQRSGSAWAMARKAWRRFWWKERSSSSNRSAPSPFGLRSLRARARPVSAGRSRMKVRSGFSPCRVTRSSRSISAVSILPD